jgi:hypothetical protein
MDAQYIVLRSGAAVRLRTLATTPAASIFNIAEL